MHTPHLLQAAAIVPESSNDSVGELSEETDCEQMAHNRRRWAAIFTAPLVASMAAFGLPCPHGNGKLLFLSSTITHTVFAVSTGLSSRKCASRFCTRMCSLMTLGWAACMAVWWCGTIKDAYVSTLLAIGVGIAQLLLVRGPLWELVLFFSSSILAVMIAHREIWSNMPKTCSEEHSSWRKSNVILLSIMFASVALLVMLMGVPVADRIDSAIGWMWKSETDQETPPRPLQQQRARQNPVDGQAFNSPPPQVIQMQRADVHMTHAHRVQQAQSSGRGRVHPDHPHTPSGQLHTPSGQLHSPRSVLQPMGHGTAPGVSHGMNGNQEFLTSERVAVSPRPRVLGRGPMAERLEAYEMLQWPHSVAPRAVDQLGRPVPHTHMHPGHPQLGRQTPFGAPAHPQQWHPHFNGVVPVRMVQRVDHIQLRILQSMQEQEMQAQLARLQHAPVQLAVQARQEASPPSSERSMETMPGQISDQDLDTSGHAIEVTSRQPSDQDHDHDQDDSSSSQSADHEDTVDTATFGTSSNGEDASDEESRGKVGVAQSASSTSLGQTSSQGTPFTATSSTYEATPSIPERHNFGDRPSPGAASSSRAASSHEALPERREVPRPLEPAVRTWLHSSELNIHHIPHPGQVPTFNPGYSVFRGMTRDRVENLDMRPTFDYLTSSLEDDDEESQWASMLFDETIQDVTTCEGSERSSSIEGSDTSYDGAMEMPDE